MEHTRGSPRLKAIRVRTRVSPSIRSVFARRPRREVRIDGVDHVALDPFGLQHPVDSKPVQTGLLDDDNREVPAGSGHSLTPELREPTQQARHIARRPPRVGHLSPAPGDRDVISQALRDSSIETKIAAKIGTDSGLRRPGCAFRHHRPSRVVGQQPHSAKSAGR